MSTPLWIALGAAFLLSLFSWGVYVLYPFRIFTTWAHECSHAAMAALLGGRVRKITLAPDTSGLTFFEIGPGRLKHAGIASAGYLGASAVGCLIYWASVSDPSRARAVLIALGAVMIATCLVWIRGFFGFFAILAMGIGSVAYGRSHAFSADAPAVLAFLGIQTGLNALLDLKTLFSLSPSAKSDARTMSSLLWLPAAFWAALWIALSLGLMGWTILSSSRTR